MDPPTRKPEHHTDSPKRGSDASIKSEKNPGKIVDRGYIPANVCIINIDNNVSEESI